MTCTDEHISTPHTGSKLPLHKQLATLFKASMSLLLQLWLAIPLQCMEYMDVKNIREENEQMLESFIVVSLFEDKTSKTIQPPENALALTK